MFWNMMHAAQSLPAVEDCHAFCMARPNSPSLNRTRPPVPASHQKHAPMHRMNAEAQRHSTASGRQGSPCSPLTCTAADGSVKYVRLTMAVFRSSLRLWRQPSLKPLAQKSLEVPKITCTFAIRWIDGWGDRAASRWRGRWIAWAQAAGTEVLKGPENDVDICGMSVKIDRGIGG